VLVDHRLGLVILIVMGGVYEKSAGVALLVAVLGVKSEMSLI
jgi:hypothetical protein